MNWDDLRFVLAVARVSSLAAAARRLQVDQTTVSRRLASLERSTGTKLFQREQGRLVPTEFGECAAARAERVESEMIALESDLTGADTLPEGRVRVTSVPIVMNRLLIPKLGILARQYPKLTLELISEPRNLSLTKRDADIAVRLARPITGSALCRRIGSLPYSVFGPRRGDIQSLPWLTYTEDYAHLPQARWIAANRAAAEDRHVLANDAESLLQAVSAGLGRSLLPDFLGEADTRVKRVSSSPVLEREVWLLVHPDARHLPRIAVVIDWLQNVVDGAGR